MAASSIASRTFARQTPLAMQGRPRSMVVVRAASGGRTGKVKAPGKTAQVKAPRKTKKVEVDDDTVGTVGALGIFGVAIATAGFLFVNSTYEVTSPGEAPVVSAPEPTARMAPLPAADTGSKVKALSAKDAPPPAAPKKEVKVEEKPALPPVAAYVPPPAIKVGKTEVGVQGVEQMEAAPAPVTKPAAPAPAPVAMPAAPTPAPVFKAPTPAPAAAPAPVTSVTSGSSSTATPPSPAVLGGAAVVGLVVVAAAAAGNTTTTEAAPQAPSATSSSGSPAAMTSEASMEDRLKDRRAWIAAYRARK